MGKQLQDTLQRSGIVHLMLFYGDALWYNNDSASALSAYEKILGLDLSPRYNEAAALRLAGIHDQQLRTALPSFFTGSFSDSSSMLFLENLEQHNTNPLIPYLKAKIYFKMKRYAEATRECGKISSTLGSPILDASKEEVMGEINFRLNEFQTAKLHFWQSLNYSSSETTHQRINDWLERCSWFEDHKQ